MLVIIMGGIMRRNYKIIIISVYHISETSEKNHPTKNTKVS